MVNSNEIPLHTSLTADEMSQLNRDSRACAAKLLQDVLHDVKDWKFFMEKRDVKFYKKSSSNGSTYSINGITRVTANLDEVMHMIFSETTDDFRTLMNELHQDRFKDGSVLCTTPHRSAKGGILQERCNVKWMHFASSSSMSKSRDYCVADYWTIRPSNRMMTDENHRIGIQTFSSVTRPDCPKGVRAERGVLDPSGFVVYPTKVPGVVEVIFSWGVQEQSISRNYKKTILGIAQCLCRLSATLSARRISATSAIMPVKWSEERNNLKCTDCSQNFSPFRRKKNCRLCGKVACSKCCAVKAVKIPGIGISQLRVCVPCTDSAKHEPKPKKAKSKRISRVEPAAKVSFKAHPSIEEEKEQVEEIQEKVEEIEEKVEEIYGQVEDEELVGDVDEELEEKEHVQIMESNPEAPNEFGIPRQNRLDSEDGSVDSFADESMYETSSNASSERRSSMSSMQATMESMKKIAEVENFNYSLDFDWKYKWPKYPLPPDEAARCQKVISLDILDSGAQEDYDVMVQCAKDTFKTPFAFISFIDKKREWFKASIGFPINEVDRHASFGAHAIMSIEATVVCDTLNDIRFVDNPYVTQKPRLRFYAAFPIISHEGLTIGVIAVADVKPRNSVTTKSLNVLEKLASNVMTLVDQRGYSIASVSVEMTQRQARVPPSANIDYRSAMESLLEKSLATEMEVAKTSERMQEERIKFLQ